MKKLMRKFFGTRVSISTTPVVFVCVSILQLQMEESHVMHSLHMKKETHQIIMGL